MEFALIKQEMQQPYGQHARLQIESFRLKFWPLITSGSYPHKVCRQVASQSECSSKYRISNGTRNLLKSTGKFTSREKKQYSKFLILMETSTISRSMGHQVYMTCIYLCTSTGSFPCTNWRVTDQNHLAISEFQMNRLNVFMSKTFVQFWDIPSRICYINPPPLYRQTQLKQISTSISLYKCPNYVYTIT